MQPFATTNRLAIKDLNNDQGGLWPSNRSFLAFENRAICVLVVIAQIHSITGFAITKTISKHSTFEALLVLKHMQSNRLHLNLPQP